MHRPRSRESRRCCHLVCVPTSGRSRASPLGSGIQKPSGWHGHLRRWQLQRAHGKRARWKRTAHPRPAQRHAGSPLRGLRSSPRRH
eukprot:9980755-Heterocapsa_arctica.AAC.1